MVNKLIYINIDCIDKIMGHCNTTAMSDSSTSDDDVYVNACSVNGRLLTGYSKASISLLNSSIFTCAPYLLTT